MDLGDGMGHEVVLDPQNGIFITPPSYTIRELKALDQDSFFHNSTPSWNAGRVYLAQEFFLISGQSFYLVNLQGHSNIVGKQFSVPASNFTLNLDCDTAGNVLSFTSSASG